MYGGYLLRLCGGHFSSLCAAKCHAHYKVASASCYMRFKFVLCECFGSISIVISDIICSVLARSPGETGDFNQWNSVFFCANYMLWSMSGHRGCRWHYLTWAFHMICHDMFWRDISFPKCFDMINVSGFEFRLDCSVWNCFNQNSIQQSFYSKVHLYVLNLKLNWMSENIEQRYHSVCYACFYLLSMTAHPLSIILLQTVTVISLKDLWKQVLGRTLLLIWGVILCSMFIYVIGRLLVFVINARRICITIRGFVRLRFSTWRVVIRLYLVICFTVHNCVWE